MPYTKTPRQANEHARVREFPQHVIGIHLPYSPVANALGMTPLPPLYWPILFATLLCYTTLTQFVKSWLTRRRWL